MEMQFWLIPSFFSVALVYSMAGFAGGSSYLALLVLSGMDYRLLPAVALVCNLAVASHSFYFFRRHFSLKSVLPFAVTSVPLAYLGGRMEIEKKTFILLLGLSLLAAGFRLFFSRKKEAVKSVSAPVLWTVGILSGAVLGFLAGLVGIGGGIFLSPLLMLMGWADAKRAAGAAAFFILIN